MLPMLPSVTSGGASLPNGCLYQYGASPDPGTNGDTATYTGNVYYIDFAAGNDANSGQSKALPWKTVSRVAQACYPVGGSAGTSEAPRGSAFLFKRGQPDQTGNIEATGHDGSGWYANYTFDTYGTGARPKITYATGMPVVDSFATIGASGHPGLMHSPRVANLHIDGANTAYGIFYTWTDGVVVWNCEVENCGGPGIGLSLADQFAANGVLGANVSNCTVHKTCNVSGDGAGIGGGGGEDGTFTPAINVVITYNTCYDNGTAGTTTSHQFYMFGMGAGSIVYGNYGYQTQDLGNFGLVVHGYCSNVLIQRNFFNNCGNGIGVNSGSYSGVVERFDQFDISQNIVANVGTFSTGSKTGLYLACLTNSKVWGNLVYNCGLTDVLCTVGIAGDFQMDNVDIVQNTFYRTTGSAISGQTLNVGQNLGTIRFANNVCYQTASTGNSQFFISKTSAMTDANLTLSNNCFLTSVSGSKTHLWNGTQYTLAAFQAAFPTKEVASIYQDPLFVDPSTQNFRLQSTSPAKALGTALSYTIGLDGRRFSLTTPAAGCYAAPN